MAKLEVQGRHVVLCNVEDGVPIVETIVYKGVQVGCQPQTLEDVWQHGDGRDRHGLHWCSVKPRGQRAYICEG